MRLFSIKNIHFKLLGKQPPRQARIKGLVGPRHFKVFAEQNIF